MPQDEAAQQPGPQLEVEAQRDPEGGVEAALGLGLAHGLQPRADLVLGEDSKAEVLIEGPVPGDVLEGSERKSRKPVGDRPVPHPVDKCSAGTLALMGGSDADLLDVGATIDHVYEDVADRERRTADCDPGAATPRVTCEDFERCRFVVSDVAQAIVPVALPGGAFDLLKVDELVLGWRANKHQTMIAGPQPPVPVGPAPCRSEP